MNWYTLMRMDDGSVFDEIEASDAGWAALRFLKKVGGERLVCDVAIIRDGMVHAIVSERGGRRPDVMVINEMRAKLTTGQYLSRPAGVAKAVHATA